MTDPTSTPPSGRLGATAVFLTAISTILGAIMFLRFGYAVGQVGLIGTLAIIALGHLVTIPTSMAIAEIATNQRVAGGGAYHIVSRSFGVVTGAAIGISLYLSQAISVAFYVIAFAESFRPLIAAYPEWFGMLTDMRMITLPATVLLAMLMVWKGADLGVKALYLVVATLFVSLLMFFFGHTGHQPSGWMSVLADRVDQPVGFFTVFAIIFPAFTGVAAGLGLSGDLKDPRRAIPLGTISATAVGMLVYVLLSVKLSLSATPDELVSDQFIMSKIALWGPIIPIGLAAATFSSALGSMLIAPRTLQAMASDAVLPAARANQWLARNAAGTREPVNATIVTTAIALMFVLLGDVDFVAQIISMFFMVTYGSICLVSFFEHFAADPSYRPGFRSRWYISLFGALACLWLMFEMSPAYALLAIVCMFGLYYVVSHYNPERRGLTFMFQGALFQFSRTLQVFSQKATTAGAAPWRPSVVAISRHSFERLDAFELLRWISFRYGFGTYIHYLEGYFSKATVGQARQDQERLVARANASGSNVYVDTLVCPSATSLIAQVIQLPGISGKDNNMILFEAPRDDLDQLSDMVDNYQLILVAGFDIACLVTSARGFGYRREIHLWLTAADFENSSLMILLSYILLGHPDWRRGTIRVFAVAARDRVEEEEERLVQVLRKGRIPIARGNVEVVSLDDDTSRKDIVNEQSADADLVVMGFRGELLRRQGVQVFDGYEGLANTLFVNTTQEIELDRPAEPVEPRSDGEADSRETGDDVTAARRADS